nr:MAG TPA: hypothetical protein [Caudoviricetes sp.]
MALTIKYNPELSDKENFNELLKDAGYPADRIAELRIARTEPNETVNPADRNAIVYIEVPADLAAKYDNENQESITPQTEGNKVFRHTYRTLNISTAIKAESTVIDSEVGFTADEDITNSPTIRKANGSAAVFKNQEDANRIIHHGRDGDVVDYGQNIYSVSFVGSLAFHGSIPEAVTMIKADATAGKQLLFKLTLNGQGDTSEYSVPKGTYEGADVAFAGKGNTIKRVPITLHDLLVLDNSVLNTKYNELAYEDAPHRKQFLHDKFAFTRVSTVPQKTIFPEGLELSIPEGASGLIRYASPMAKYPEVHGNVNTYVLPLLAKEAADYCSKFLDTEEKFKFDKIDTQSNKNIVVFKTGKYNQETDLPKFEAFIGKMLNETGLERSEAPTTVTYDGSVVIHKVFVDPSDDMFMSEPIYIALVPLEEKLTLKEGMDGFNALKLADEDTLPEI